jgi:hypothetical protein
LAGRERPTSRGSGTGGPDSTGLAGGCGMPDGEPPSPVAADAAARARPLGPHGRRWRAAAAAFVLLAGGGVGAVIYGQPHGRPSGVTTTGAAARQMAVPVPGARPTSSSPTSVPPAVWRPPPSAPPTAGAAPTSGAARSTAARAQTRQTPVVPRRSRTSPPRPQSPTAARPLVRPSVLLPRSSREVRGGRSLAQVEANQSDHKARHLAPLRIDRHPSVLPTARGLLSPRRRPAGPTRKPRIKRSLLRASRCV